MGGHQPPAAHHAGLALSSATIGHSSAPTHSSPIGSASYTYGPTRLALSVIHVRSLHGIAIHPPQNPVELLDLLIR